MTKMEPSDARSIPEGLLNAGPVPTLLPEMIVLSPVVGSTATIAPTVLPWFTIVPETSISPGVRGAAHTTFK